MPVLPTDDSLLKILCLALSGRADDVAWTTLTEENWGELVTTARAEGVAPLLYQTLEARGMPAGIPSPLHDQLWKSYHTTATRNLIAYREISRILSLLAVIWQPAHAVAGAPPTTEPPPLRDRGETPGVLLLKGAALAATLYDNIGLRPFGDVDILVPRPALEGAREALGMLGYSEAVPDLVEGLGEAVRKELLLRGGPHNQVAVELHWGLIAGDNDWRTVPTDWFWATSEPWSPAPQQMMLETGESFVEATASIPVRQMAPTPLLLYLAAHLMLQHGGGQAGLLWYYDIDLLIRRRGAEIHWGDLIDQAVAFRWVAALHAALAETQTRFETPFPEGLLDRLRDAAEPHVARLVAQKTAAGRSPVLANWANLTTVAWPLRLRLLLGLVVPSRERMQWRYKPQPAWLWPLYYPYRWLHLLRECTIGLARLARRS